MDREWNPLAPEGGSTWTWWRNNFPVSSRIYGDPVVFGEPNLDFLAHALSEAPVGLIYYPPEGRFYFRDYLFEGAYRPTSNGKVEALVRKLVVESVEDGPKTLREGSKTLFLCSGAARERSEVIIAVEGHYFTGEEGHRRWIEGRYVEPVEKPSVALFAETRVARRRGKILTNADAYRFYYAFCHESGLPPVKKTVFIDRFSQEIRKKWKIGLRNDLKVDGRSFSGWGELAVV